MFCHRKIINFVFNYTTSNKYEWDSVTTNKFLLRQKGAICMRYCYVRITQQNMNWLKTEKVQIQETIRFKYYILIWNWEYLLALCLIQNTEQRVTYSKEILVKNVVLVLALLASWFFKREKYREKHGKKTCQTIYQQKKNARK